MREIRFRAWDKVGKYFVRFTVKLGEEVFLDPTRFTEELYLFTGLKDKNGKECYWSDWVTDGINPTFLVTPDYHLLARLSEIEFEIAGNEYEGLLSPARVI